MSMKKLILYGLTAAVFALTNPAVFAETTVIHPEKREYQPGTWTEDYTTAMQAAARLKRPLLMNFTGSDWCGWCIQLDKEVFSTGEFMNYAKGSLVLLKVDFPSKKSQTSSLKKQNKALADGFKVRGFPTIILLDHKGKEIAKMGYQKGGAKKFVEHLQGLLEKK